MNQLYTSMSKGQIEICFNIQEVFLHYKYDEKFQQKVVYREVVTELSFQIQN